MGFIRIRKNKSAKHMYYADKARRARIKNNGIWGGRRTDGLLDGYDPSVFSYKKKIRNATGTTYYYPLNKRKAWPSYGRKY